MTALWYRTWVRSVSAGILAGLSVACSPYLSRYAVPAGAEPTDFYEDQSRPDLALLEYRIAKFFAAQSRPYTTACAVAVQIEPHDPDSEAIPLDQEIEARLLARFPDLKPANQCKREGLSILDRETGEPAALFDVHGLDCETQPDCSAWAGYYAYGTHGWSWYWVEWRDGMWTIRPRKSEIVLT